MTRAVEAFRGSLLTRHFVEHVLGQEFAGRLGEASVPAMRRHCGRRVREAHARLGPASSVRAICETGAVPLLRQIGYAVRAVRLQGHAEHGGHHLNGEVIVATLEAAHGVALTLVVCPWQERLDRVWRVAVQSGLSVRQRWCLCFNGRQLRVIDVDRPYARRFLEFDLCLAMEDAGAFQLLWALLRPQALARSSRSLALLDQIVGACDTHGGSVREALQHGVRHALASLATALARADRHTPGAAAADIVGQALTIIYRLLFLLFAEARALVPVWHPIYRDSYSVGALHALAGQRNPRGLWPAVQAISRLAHDGCATDDLSVTAFNGQLFSPEHTPLGERLSISSAVISEVLDALMTTPARRGNGADGRGRERITYADLGVEQLGTVYERVLDYAPQLEHEIHALLENPARRRGHSHVGSRMPQNPEQQRPRAAAHRSSARRKETGSFYTPRSMADYLVRVTLGPLVAKASADEILSLRVLDPAMGSGAFLVSACRFLAHAVAARDPGGAPADVRRYIARHCLFGVDLNPMAVQLARLSLWLTTMMRNAPLTFLDHHFRVGDSLVGASLDDLVRRPPVRSRSSTSGRRGAHAAGSRAGAVLARTRRDDWGANLPLFSGIEHAHVMRAILPSRKALTALDDSPATVREKERLLQSLARDGALSRWLQLADVWCASWFADTGAHSGAVDAGVQSGASGEARPAASGERQPAVSGEAAPAAAWPALVDYLLHGHAVFPQPTLDAWLDAVRRTAARQRFFHWTLEFPEVFFDAEGQPLDNGGFDAIVGNPPWDMIRNDAREDQASGEDMIGRDRDTAAGPEKHTAALSRFVRQAGLYRSTGDAHLNCYHLFVERSLALLKRGGRFGLVLPWGIAGDHGSARLRRRLLESCDLDTLVSFENNRAIFPIHRSTRFALLSGTTGRPTRAVRCHFGERDPAVLDTFSFEHEGMSEHGQLREPLNDQEPLNEREPLSERKPLNEQEHTTGSPSACRRRALVVTPDFLRHVSGEGLGFPDARTPMDIALLERLHATHPPLASADGWHVKFGRELNESDDRALLQPATRESSMPVVDGKRLRPFAVALESFRYAVSPEHQRQLQARLPDVARTRLAFRDIASPTNRLTLIAAMLPAGVVSTHTVSCLKSSLDVEAQWCLCALLNSFVANYLVRMRVSTHVTVAMIERMPAPTPLRDSPVFHELAQLAEQLSRATEATTHGAQYPRLQALAARAYDLSDGQFRYVLTTFPLIEEQTKRAALAYFVPAGADGVAM
jgi:hypothetical protein